MNQRPVAEPCPECGGLMAHSGRNMASCTVCDWKERLQDAKELATVGD